MGTIIKIAKISKAEETQQKLEQLVKKNCSKPSLKNSMASCPARMETALPTKKRCGMSGIRLLADTNAFIYLLNGHPSLQSLLKSTWLYSFITEIELLGKPGITPAEIKKIKSLLSACVKVQHTEAVNETAIALKQRHKLKIPDAIIAATAIKQGIPLLTFDKDFTKIEEVDIVLLES